MCLITGANRGVGLALAAELVTTGFRVIGTARQPERASELRACGACVHALEVTSDDSIAALAHELRSTPIDVLVNNAGILGNERSADRHGPHFGGLVRDDFDRTIAVNTVSPVMLVQALRPMLDAGVRKQIVNLSSTLGSLELANSSGPWAYRASKAALNMVTRSLAVEPRLAGYTVVSVHPGWVRTEMGGEGGEISAEESARDISAFLDVLRPEHNGGFFDRTGKRLPW